MLAVIEIPGWLPAGQIAPRDGIRKRNYTSRKNSLIIPLSASPTTTSPHFSPRLFISLTPFLPFPSIFLPARSRHPRDIRATAAGDRYAPAKYVLSLTYQLKCFLFHYSSQPARTAPRFMEYTSAHNNYHSLLQRTILYLHFYCSRVSENPTGEPTNAPLNKRFNKFPMLPSHLRVALPE